MTRSQEVTECDTGARRGKIHLFVKKLKKNHGNTINLICIIFLALKDLSAVVYILFAIVYTRNERLFSVDKSSK